MIRSEIIGLGTWVPQKVVTNNDLEKLMDTTDEWIFTRTGIKERRWVRGEAIGPADLGLKASEEALKNANVSKEEIDLIVFATLSPDYMFPGSGCVLQSKMGLSKIPALDIRQQCSGFVYGLSVADQFIRSGMYKTVLLVGGEVHSSGLDVTTRGRDVSVLFGDGAGAAILRAKEVKNPQKDSYLYSSHLHADGRFAQELWLPAPGTAYAAPMLSHEILDQGLQYPKMNGKKVFVHAVEKMEEVLSEGLKTNNLKLSDIDLFFFHQANLRINEAVAQKCGIDPKKIFNTIHKYGNTTAATLPLGMRDAEKEGVLKKGHLVATVAFGSGFTWGCNIFRY